MPFNKNHDLPLKLKHIYISSNFLLINTDMAIFKKKTGNIENECYAFFLQFYYSFCLLYTTLSYSFVTVLVVI